MIAEVLLSIVVGLFSYAFYKWATLNNDYFEKRNIKFMKPKFLVGSFGGLFMNKYTATELAELFYEPFPNEPIGGYFEFRTPSFVVIDPKVLKQIGVKDFEHFLDHDSFVDENVESLFGNGLFALRGDKWREMRATLSPAFTGSKMRQMFDLVSQCAYGIVEHFSKQASAGERINIEMKDFFSRYTNDVIATCAFGLKVNSIADPTNEFYTSGKALSDFGGFLSIIKILLIKQFPAISRKLNIRVFDATLANKFSNMVLDTMEQRKKHNIHRPDMINILMQVRDGSLNHQSDVASSEASDGFATVEESGVGKSTTTRQWTDEELVAQCFLFFFAGFDTASTLLTFAAYELVVNPDIQQRLYEEIAETNEMIGGKQVTYDDLQKMKYLDQVICETLRKWPPFVNGDRICTKNYRYRDENGLEFDILKGQTIMIPTYAIQHDPKYFPNPEKFDPERFNDENKDNIIPGTYIPFGIGPRNCIGSRFALMELKAILYYLLLNFSFEANGKTEIPVKLKKSFNLSTKNGMHLELKPRIK